MKKRNLFDRIEALKVAHPHIKFVQQYAPSGLRLWIFCPCSYGRGMVEGSSSLVSFYSILDGTYTITGAKRKITELERMDWTCFDDIANRAYLQRVKIEGGVQCK